MIRSATSTNMRGGMDAVSNQNVKGVVAINAALFSEYHTEAHDNGLSSAYIKFSDTLKKFLKSLLKAYSESGDLVRFLIVGHRDEQKELLYKFWGFGQWCVESALLETHLGTKFSDLFFDDFWIDISPDNLNDVLGTIRSRFTSVQPDDCIYLHSHSYSLNLTEVPMPVYSVYQPHDLPFEALSQLSEVVKKSKESEKPIYLYLDVDDTVFKNDRSQFENKTCINTKLIELLSSLHADYNFFNIQFLTARNDMPEWENDCDQCSSIINIAGELNKLGLDVSQDVRDTIFTEWRKFGKRKSSVLWDELQCENFSNDPKKQRDIVVLFFDDNFSEVQAAYDMKQLFKESGVDLQVFPILSSTEFSFDPTEAIKVLMHKFHSRSQPDSTENIKALMREFPVGSQGRNCSILFASSSESKSDSEDSDESEGCHQELGSSGP